MLDPVILNLVDAANALPLPSAVGTTVGAQSIYRQGLDRANSYRGDLTPLVEALDLFQQTDSRPFFYAGVAYTILIVACRCRPVCDLEGLELARGWLEQAREIAGEVAAIEVVFLFIEIYSGNDDSAGRIMTRLLAQASHDYHLHTAVIAYHFHQGAVAPMADCYDRTLALAKTIARRAYLANEMAYYYRQLGQADESLRMYQVLAQITPEDPWLWHDISAIYLARYDLIRAHRFNRRALALMEFDAARRLAGEIYRKGVLLMLAAAWILFVLIALSR
jgi:tetratricopeptide (TPR) repeat protein